MKRRTVHLICNAHIDPVWLWPWTAGLDEIVSTCEAVCGLLERNPDVIFTRGEAWVYEQILSIAPKLFSRIQTLVRKGQWEIVGGWYIQPDCNLPGRRGIERQISLGRAFFMEHFGVSPKIAYNVDSFGHHAGLPGLLRAAGQDCYVMMRPEQHEMAIPASLFWWRGVNSGPALLTFRIEGAYCTTAPLTPEHIEKSVRSLPEGVSHTMCFIGIGDHGGGPSQDMIDWCREHRHTFKGIDLVFSSPSRFFQAVKREANHAPTVTGELQPHAVGCYTVHRAVKTRARRAEELLTLAENAVARDAELKRRTAAELDKAWRWLCFSQFHDTLGGTAVASAYPQVDAQLGYACAVGDEITALASRRNFAALSPDAAQRIAVQNFGFSTFDDWVEHEPWLEWTSWKPDWGLVDERGRRIPHQLLRGEASHGEAPRLLFRIKAEPGELRSIRIVQGAVAIPKRSPAPSLHRRGSGEQVLRCASDTFTLPQLQLVEDPSDTWSHGVTAFDGNILAHAEWKPSLTVDQGPLLWAWIQEGNIGRSRLRAEWRHYAGAPYRELRLEVHWQEEQKLLRLIWPQLEAIRHRIDGMPGQGVRRPSDGAERPLHGWTRLMGATGVLGAVVTPDVFALSSTPEALRLTLLRSPIMAHHEPDTGQHPRRVYADQGTHSFMLRFYPTAPSIEKLSSTAASLQCPPVKGDVTRGMPLRAYRGAFNPAQR